MQYIHYHNDFIVPISLVSDFITINPDIIHQITFYTRNNGNSYCCCRDCKTLYRDGTNMMAVLNNHNLETGVLNYMVEYQLQDETFPDGYQKLCQHYTSDIELTTENGDITVAEAQIIYGDTIRELIESAGYSYTKEEVDEMIEGISAQVNTYTKPEIDSKLSTKANTADVYDKTTIDEMFENIDLPDNVVTDANYVHTDNNYTTTEKNKLSGIASGAEVNVQSDWNVTNSSSDAFIKNKPTIPTVDLYITGSSQSNPVRGAAIYNALNGKVDFVEYGDLEELTDDVPSNGAIGFDGDNENFYIYNFPTGEWTQLDKPILNSIISGSPYAVSGGTIYTALAGKAEYKVYNSQQAMEADSPANGTIGYNADDEGFYIYEMGNAEWRRIDSSSNEMVIEALNLRYTVDNFPYYLRMRGEWDNDAGVAYLIVEDTGDGRYSKIPMGANLLSENGFEELEITDGYIVPFKYNIMKPTGSTLSIRPNTDFVNAPGVVIGWIELNADDLTNVTRLRWNNFVFPENESIEISDFSTYSKMIITVMGTHITNIARYT